MNLIDTNIFVYAYDIHEINKREKCLGIVKSVFTGVEKAYISNQILGELFYVLTQNMKKPLSAEMAEEVVISIIESNNWLKIDYNHKTVMKAIAYTKRFKIPFWDALIVATMIENNVFTIYTEDEKDFSGIPGLEVVNPLV